MKKIAIAVGLLAALAFPGGAAAKVTKQDKRNAAKECKTERGTTEASRLAFAERYGTGEDKSNAFGKCVSQTKREEAAERRAAKRRAAKSCREERGTTLESREDFAQKYGTNRNKRNAFGKCVAGKAKKIKARADKKDRKEANERRNAAKECDGERGSTPESREAFAQKYGTNRNKRNAFGKCVSQKVRDSAG